MRKTRTAEVLKALEKNCWKLYPKPDQILTDNGKQFTSSTFAKRLNELDIKHIRTSNYNPGCNGIVERTHQTVANVLRLNRGCYIEELKQLIERRMNLVARSNT